MPSASDEEASYFTDIIEKMSGKYVGLDDYEKLESVVIGEDFLDYITQSADIRNGCNMTKPPLNSSGKRMKLLLQINSEDDANLMWGDAGLVYIFYDPDNPGTFEYVRQEG